MGARWKRPTTLATVIIGLALACSLGGSAGAAAQEEEPGAIPVLFFHGYNIFPPCPMSDVAFTFGSVRHHLLSFGRVGPIAAVGYYACDPEIGDDDWIDEHGPFGHNDAHGDLGHEPHLTGPWLSHNSDADLRHLAYHLAWFIWDRYSSQGLPVHLVGYSMGGLVVRWMMYRVDIGDPEFPPTLLVDAAVMVGTPFAGVRELTFDVCVTLSFETLQCEQMRAGNPFLRELAGWDGTAGAQWSTISSLCDELVTPASAQAIAPARHFFYTLPCYTHSGPLGLLGGLPGPPVVVSERGPDTGPWRPSAARGSLALLHELLP